MCLGISLVFLLAYVRARKHKILIDDLFIIASFSLLFGLIGASALHAITTYPIKTLIKLILSGNFEFLGGLVFYGGLIFGILGGIIGIKISKIKIQTIEACIVPFLPLGHAIGRFGCLMAGCCNGIEYDGLFAIHYPNSVAGLFAEQGYFPVQILEALLNIMVSAFLIIYTKKERKKYSILFLYLLLYSAMRFLLEFLRGDAVRGIYFGISTSQWISLSIFLSLSLSFLVSHLKAISKKSS